MLELTIRLIASLAVVVGLLLLTAKFFGRQFQSRAGATVQVLHRQALTRSASVSVVVVGPRVLVLGTTDQQVNVLAELDPDELDLDVEDATITALHPSDDTGADVVRPVGAHRRVARGPRQTVRLRSRVARDRADDAAQPPVPAQANTSAEFDAQGPLSGSILSPQTWRQAFAAASRRAS